MIDIRLNSKKTISRFKHEDIYEGENKISWINVYLPEKINDIDIKNYDIVLRCYINEDNYIPFNLDTTKQINKIDITHEFTDKDRYISCYLYITKGEDIIGKTNTIGFRVSKAKGGSGLTPREQFDERIAELENEVAEKIEIISKQDARIEQLDDEVEQLDHQIDALEIENFEKTQTITRQNTTIDELNRRVPPLQQLDPINPSGIQQTYNPQSPNIGFPQVIVNPVTAEGIGFHPEYYKEGETCLGKVGTYNPFPEGSQGGIYITQIDKTFNTPVEILYKDYITEPNKSLNYTDFPSRATLERIIIDGCPTITTWGGYFVMNGRFPLLKKIDLQNSFITNIGENGISDNNNVYLEEILLPKTLTSIQFGGIKLCKALKALELPTGLEFIGAEFLQGCENIKIINIPNTVTQINGANFMRDCFSLKTISFPNSLTMINGNSYLLDRCSSLEYVTIENGFNCDNLKLSASTLYSVETIVSWLEALADRSGLTAYTLTIGTTNINKLTAEQIAIATNKNWNLT